MTFTIDNVGPIKKLCIDLGRLTVVCGANNNGKTYLSYILYSLLDTIQRNIEIPVRRAHIKTLMESGEAQIDLLDYAKVYVDVIKKRLPYFVKTLPRFMAMHPDKFRETKVDVSLSEKEVRNNLIRGCESRIGDAHGDLEISKTARIQFHFEKGSTKFRLMLINKLGKFPSVELVERTLSYLISQLTNLCAETTFFPDVFIVTCERTGVALFTKELLDVRERESSYIDKVKPEKFGSVGYQLPIEKEILFVRNLKTIAQGKSYIARQHPEILQAFLEMSGGRYEIEDETNSVRYLLAGKRVGLSLAESSSTVRSLSELFFYLKHCAREGQMLMIDEPELNLHPENQRRIARIIGMLVNAGIRVFITTHSDYIVRELNAMVRAKMIPMGKSGRGSTPFGLQRSCLLDRKDVQMFVLRNGGIRPMKYNDCARGFSVSSFDETIKDYNALYGKVLKCELQANGEPHDSE